MRQQPCRIKIKEGGGQEKVVLYIARSGCRGEGRMMDFTDVLMVGGWVISPWKGPLTYFDPRVTVTSERINNFALSSKIV